nr:MAG TPA: hypothetical protein [Caudoviricetes sp.]
MFILQYSLRYKSLIFYSSNFNLPPNCLTGL